MAVQSFQWTLSSLLAGDAQALTVLIPFFLLSLRIAVVLGMTPVLYAMPIPNRVRALVVLALAAVLSVALPVDGAMVRTTVGGIIESALIEIALGATLALGVSVAFAAFAVAGNLLDVQIGFGIAQVFDPVSNRPSALLVSAFNYAAVVVFFLVDGHHALLRAIAYSLQVFPLGTPWSLMAVASPLFKHVGGLFVLGFALAAPVVFCILLVELALGVVSRNLPQINMLVLGIPTKIVVGLAVLSLWFAGMGGAMNRVYASIYEMWEGVFLSAPQASRSAADRSGLLPAEGAR